MNPNELRDNILRAEGYGEGFKAGYSACARYVALESAKEDNAKKEAEEKKNVVPNNV